MRRYKAEIMWWIIPVVVTVVAIVCSALLLVGARSSDTDDLTWWALSLLVLILFAVVLSWLVTPASYYTTRTTALQYETYYQNIIQPSVVEERPDYVVVDSQQTAIWQIGEQNLQSYNTYLAIQRRANALPFLGWATYPVPEYLKPARVMGR